MVNFSSNYNKGRDGVYWLSYFHMIVVVFIGSITITRCNFVGNESPGHGAALHTDTKIIMMM